MNYEYVLEIKKLIQLFSELYLQNYGVFDNIFYSAPEMFSHLR